MSTGGTRGPPGAKRESWVRRRFTSWAGRQVGYTSAKLGAEALAGLAV